MNKERFIANIVYPILQLIYLAWSIALLFVAIGYFTSLTSFDAVVYYMMVWSMLFILSFYVRYWLKKKEKQNMR